MLPALWPLLLLLSAALSAAAQSPAEIGELFASETTARGPELLAGTGMSVAGGSQLTAGKSVATLRLARGGEVRLCPNTSLTASVVDNHVPKNNQELMLSMDTGAVELEYPLNDLGDTVITPDFKLMLAGPGVFHFALGVNNRGDTCIRPLRGHSASIIVSEMLGNGVYQVKQDEALMFSGGKLSGRVPLDSVCGCPRPPPVMQAKAEELPPGEPAKEQGKPSESSATGIGSATGPLAERSDARHVQAPLVFQGNQPEPLPDQPEPVYTVARIRFSALPNLFLSQESAKPIVLKPGKGEVSAKSKQNKGFLGRIKGFFAGLFRR